jgi:spore coat polysaccharide biosynthesis predicted glycosyltransferase SpsG
MACGVPGFEGKITAAGAEFAKIDAEPGSERDMELTVSFACSVKADWLIVDGYQFGAAYHQTVSGGGWRMLALDDEGRVGRYEADIVLNQNLHASESLYANRAAHTRLLLGPEYALIQRSFFKWRGLGRGNPPIARRILVTMGGGDLGNVTRKAVEALLMTNIEGMEARVALGVANPNYDSVMKAALRGGPSIRVETDIRDMGEAMAWADIAITAGGSSIYELSFLGTPFIMITTADNQKPVERAIMRLGAGLCLGWHGNVPPERISEAIRTAAFSQTARGTLIGRISELVDGLGAVRVAQAMAEALRV